MPSPIRAGRSTMDGLATILFGHSVRGGRCGGWGLAGEERLRGRWWRSSCTTRMGR